MVGGFTASTAHADPTTTPPTTTAPAETTTTTPVTTTAAATTTAAPADTTTTVAPAQTTTTAAPAETTTTAAATTTEAVDGVIDAAGTDDAAIDAAAIDAAALTPDPTSPTSTTSTTIGAPALAAASVRPEAITSVSVRNSTGADEIYTWSILEVTAGWSITSPVPGDTFTLQLPSELAGLAATFQLPDESGTSMGSCVVSNTSVTCTLSDAVAGLAATHGMVWFSGQFTDDFSGQTVLLDFVAGERVFRESVPVLRDGGSEYDGSFLKYGYWLDEPGTTMQWEIWLPSLGSSPPSVTIIDTLGAGQTLVAGSVAVMITNEVDGSGYPVNEHAAPAGSWSVTATDIGFTVSIPFPIAGYVYGVFSQSVVDPAAPGPFSNTATLTGAGDDDGSTSSQVARYAAGGIAIPEQGATTTTSVPTTTPTTTPVAPTTTPTTVAATTTLAGVSTTAGVGGSSTTPTTTPAPSAALVGGGGAPTITTTAVSGGGTLPTTGSSSWTLLTVAAFTLSGGAFLGLTARAARRKTAS